MPAPNFLTRGFSNPSPNFASKDSVEAHKNISSRAPGLLKSDTLLVDVPTLERESKFEVTTPLGIAGVRGTRFYVNAKKQRRLPGLGIKNGSAYGIRTRAPALRGLCPNP